MGFREQLRKGQVAESQISRFLQSRGWHILPVYEIEIERGKGPRLFSAERNLVAPDMLVFRSQRVIWIEAKRKTRFSWHGKTGRWVTGIDLRHYLDYLEVAARAPWPVWLLFLHCEGRAWPHDRQRWGAPPQCPTGLFGGEINQLARMESHRSDRHGQGGMVYWAVESLKRVAALDDVYISKTGEIYGEPPY